MLIAYDGTGYHGFQIQSKVPTVQGELEKAILNATGKSNRIHGAGRTDAGVHARGQVATFESDSRLSPLELMRALNFYLPEDIAVRGAVQVNVDFDPRRNANSREYRYTILNSRVRSPLDRRHSYQLPGKLDIYKMNEAGKILQGEHDFASFTNKEGNAKNTIRRVHSTEVRKEGQFVIFDMIATAFLPQQVRRTTGSLIKVGMGDVGWAEFENMVESGTPGSASQVVPACGLCLMKVNYSKFGFDHENI